MRLLLDTHALLWYMQSPHKLPVDIKEVIDDRANDVIVSAASAWEIATKYRLGRLPEAQNLVLDYAGGLRHMDAQELPVNAEHALLAGSFDESHKDPFDRLLAAQAVLERLPLVTCDPAFQHFPVTTLW